MTNQLPQRAKTLEGSEGGGLKGKQYSGEIRKERLVAMGVRGAAREVEKKNREQKHRVNRSAPETVETGGRST